MLDRMGVATRLTVDRILFQAEVLCGGSIADHIPKLSFLR